MIALDDFAGHGWGVALRALGIEEHAVEIDAAAVQTRLLNGLSAPIYPDVWGGLLGWAETPRHDLYLSSPVCPTFSAAGKGEGRKAMPQILDTIARGDWRDPWKLHELTLTTDPRTALVLQEGRRYVGIDTNAEYLDLAIHHRFERIKP